MISMHYMNTSESWGLSPPKVRWKLDEWKKIFVGRLAWSCKSVYLSLRYKVTIAKKQLPKKWRMKRGEKGDCCCFPQTHEPKKNFTPWEGKKLKGSPREVINMTNKKEGKEEKWSTGNLKQDVGMMEPAVHIKMSWKHWSAEGLSDMQNGLRRLIKADDVFKLNESKIKERKRFLKGTSN